MAKEVSEQDILNKLEQRGYSKAVDQTKDVKANYGQRQLPAGIENGIAQLVECKIGIYGDDVTDKALKGEMFFYAAGIVVQPVNFTDKNGNTSKVAGERTKIGPEPLCDTPNAQGKYKTFSDRYGRMLGWLYALGVIPGSITKDKKTLLNALAALKKAKPHFKFRTWKGNAQEIEERDGKFWVGQKMYQTEEQAKKMNKYIGREPMVNHEWQGACPAPALNGTPASVQHTADESGPAPEDFNPNDADGAVSQDEGAVNEVPDGAIADGGEEVSLKDEVLANLDTLVEQAQNEQDAGTDPSECEAQNKLKAVAEELGISKEDADAADTWVDLGQLITDAAGVSEPGQEPVPEEPEWKKGDKCFCKERTATGAVKDPKKKAIAHEVVSVNEDGVTLKGVASKKMVSKGKNALRIPFDEISRETF